MLPSLHDTTRPLAALLALISLAAIPGCSDRLLPAEQVAQSASTGRILFTEITETSPGSYTGAIVRVDTNGGSRLSLSDGVIGTPPGISGAIFIRNGFNIWFSVVGGSGPATPELLFTGRKDSVTPPVLDPGTIALSPGGTLLTYTLIDAFVPIERRSVITGVHGGIPIALPRLIAGINPRFSPDGSRLAFYSYDTVLMNGSADLCVVNVDGTGLRVLEKSEGISESMYSTIEWSPSGDRLVYVRVAGSRNEVRVIGADGTPGRTISAGAAPAWNPTGDSVIFTYADATADLYLAAADGSGTPRQVTFTPSLIELFPCYSLDGRKLLYITYDDEPSDTIGKLVVQDLATGITKVLSQSAFKGYWVK